VNRPDIKARLILAGHNQSTVAQVAKVTQSAISRVIRGELISPRVAGVIASAIGSTPADLWPNLYGRSGTPLKRPRAA